MADRVSILIPCLNAERWIAQSIESALDQTWRDVEVVIVDDGSTDRSLEIIRRFGARVKWETGPNRGGNRARNRLLELAEGDFVQYLDADDYLLPEKIESQMLWWKENPAADVIFGPVILEHWSEDGSRSEVLPIAPPHDPWILLARWFLPQTGALLWRRQAILEAGGWKPDQPCCQEHELYLRMLMAGKRFAYLEKSGAVYRQWGADTVCNRNPTQTREQRLDIEQRAEDWLRTQNSLTEDRLWAINQARFEMARIAWQTDRGEARRIMSKVRDAQAAFVPAGIAVPTVYRMAFRIGGFEFSETLADFRRRLLPRRAVL